MSKQLKLEIIAEATKEFFSEMPWLLEHLETSALTKEDYLLFLKDFIINPIMSSATKAYWFSMFRRHYLDTKEVSSVELIKHYSDEQDRRLEKVFAYHDVKDCELIIQDEGKTLKIFV